jgi:hypothetical protein
MMTAAANRTTVNTYGGYPGAMDAIRRRRKSIGQPRVEDNRTSLPSVRRRGRVARLYPLRRGELAHALDDLVLGAVNLVLVAAPAVD